jgi:hypothetical protein
MLSDACGFIPSRHPFGGAVMQKGFFGSLFDISFRSLVTTKIIKVVYVLYMIVIGLVALGFIVSAFHASAAAGLLVLLIGAPVGFLIYVIFGRVWLEVVIVLFRIMENTQQLVDQGAWRSGPTGPTGPSNPPPPPSGASESPPPGT